MSIGQNIKRIRIRKRSIEIELSDEDVKSLAEMAGVHGLSIGQLLENFISDLTGGARSNGSDEEMLAKQWFDRCWRYHDATFLRFLIEYGNLSDVMDSWEEIEEGKKDLADYEVNPDKYNQEEIEFLKEDMGYWQEELDECWKEYCEWKGKYKSGSFEEEMKKVLEWWQKYNEILNN